MQLTIYAENWNETKDNPLGVGFPERFDIKNKRKMSFRKYTDVANYLDSHLELKNRVMLLKTPSSIFGKKVIFDGIDTFIEGRGHV